MLAAGGVGHALVTSVESGMRRVDPFGVLRGRPDTGRGLTFLLVGADSREDLPAAERAAYQLGDTACNCADTIMLVHLSEDRDRTSIVSLPRDTQVELAVPGRGGAGPEATRPAKLNTALAQGGPSLLVSTVEDLTGVRVDHYAEVGFAGFVGAVDELGGVAVCTARPLADTSSGLDLPAGTSVLDGADALAYVRARHVDGGSDIARMERQQRFLAAFLDQVVDSEVLLDPAQLSGTARAVLSAVRTDRGFGVAELLALVRAMRGLRTAATEFASVPVTDVDRQVPGLGSTVVWEKRAATRLFAALREDRPLAPRDAAVPVDVAPETVQVQVANATARQGLAGRVDAALREIGFATTGVPQTAGPRAPSETTISHAPSAHAAATTLQRAVPAARLREVEGHGPVLVLTLGQDHDQVRRVREAGRPVTSKDWEPGGYGATTADRMICENGG